MSKGSSFVKFFNPKAKPKKGLRKGSFTPLQIVRSKGSSTLAGGKVVKSKLATGIIKSKVIPETPEYQSDLMDFHQTRVTSGDQQQLIKKSNCIKTVLDLESHLPVIKKPIIIPETQNFDDAIDYSQKKRKSNNILAEDRSWSKKLEISPDTNMDSDLIMMVEDEDWISDVIPSTYDVHKKEFGVANKTNKVLEKNKDSGAAVFKMNKPPIVKPTTLAHANTKVLYAIDDMLKNSIVAKLNESKYKPAKKEERKLADMSVKMRHQVLPQHQVERTAGTRTMKQDERTRFEKYATLRKGPFSTSEDEKIEENWKTFCQDNDWDPQKPEPYLLMKHNGNKKFLMYNLENRRNFVRCLAHGLPDRCLYSVNHRFRNLFGNSNNNTDKYTEAEDREIRQYLSAYPHLKAANESDRQFADLAIILKRTRGSVWRRFRILKEKMEEIKTSPSSPSIARGSDDASSRLPQRSI